MKRLFLLSIIFLSQLYFSQSDCISAIPVCGNSDLSYTPSGHGDEQEELGGCLSSNERYSVWYTFTIATAGTLTFVISPYANDDYDFAVYGPNVQCSSRGAPIRCSYASAKGDTGLSMTATALSEGAGGTRFVKYMDVVPGETYYLIVNNHSQSTNGFALTWGGTATLASAFNDEDIAPNPFIPPGVPSTITGDSNEIFRCMLPTTFDFSTLSNGIINGNTGFTASYHYTANDAITGNNAITAPTTVNAGITYFYRLKYTDPNNPSNPINNCFQTGKFVFIQGNIVARDATIYACNNDNIGTATFNLTSADVFSGSTNTKKYYPTLDDMTAGTNQITNPANYVSSEKTVYVMVTTEEGCTDTAEIQLVFYPVVITNDASLESCFIQTNIGTASFDLTEANVSTLLNPTRRYYPTLANATSGTNAIQNPSNYVTTSSDVYVRVYSEDGCYSIAKIALTVLPPVSSNILKDKIICIENTTTLDAGSGFDSYEWSTGETTQTISNVSVGSYWVKLQTGKCFTLQLVNVYPSKQPVITGVDIKLNTVTVHVNGGTPPYQYSLDGFTWQDSNIFTDLSRGEVKVYVKDNYNCIPVNVQVTVPHLINAITPNGDNKNDYIDYSALAYKKNLIFTVYDRYGNQLYTADKIRNYKWDGTAFGKKIPTGTYWYTISWNENNKDNTPIKYNGWILVKNRE